MGYEGYGNMGENGTNDGQVGVHLKSRTASAEFNSRLGIECGKTKQTTVLWSCGEKDSDD